MKQLLGIRKVSLLVQIRQNDADPRGPELEVTKRSLTKVCLATNVDLSQTLISQYHRASLWISFPQLRGRWMELVYLSTVAEQMHECINVKNPPNCVGGNLRIISCQLF
jgi:hypothetical protein